jgi:hypothetical protein
MEWLMQVIGFEETTCRSLTDAKNEESFVKFSIELSSIQTIPKLKHPIMKKSLATQEWYVAIFP